jgi:hypothetical protein
MLPVTCVRRKSDESERHASEMKTTCGIPEFRARLMEPARFDCLIGVIGGFAQKPYLCIPTSEQSVAGEIYDKLAVGASLHNCADVRLYSRDAQRAFPIGETARLEALLTCPFRKTLCSLSRGLQGWQTCRIDYFIDADGNAGSPHSWISIVHHAEEACCRVLCDSVPIFEPKTSRFLGSAHWAPRKNYPVRLRLFGIHVGRGRRSCYRR